MLLFLYCIDYLVSKYSAWSLLLRNGIIFLST